MAQNGNQQNGNQQNGDQQNGDQQNGGQQNGGQNNHRHEVIGFMVQPAGAGGHVHSANTTVPHYINVGEETTAAEDAIVYTLDILITNPSRGDVLIAINGVPVSIYPDGYTGNEPINYMTDIPEGQSAIITTDIINPLFKTEWNVIEPYDDPPIEVDPETGFVTITMDSPKVIVGSFEPISVEAFSLTRSDVLERVSDVFYKKYFLEFDLTHEQILALQTTVRGGGFKTGRTEDEQLVFYKKDRNTLENQSDLQIENFALIVDHIYTDYAQSVEATALYDYLYGGGLENHLGLIEVSQGFDVAPENLTPEEWETLRIDLGIGEGLLKHVNYSLRYQPTDTEIKIATQLFEQIGEELTAINPPFFTDALNLSNITAPKIGGRVDPNKAEEVLDTKIYELLPYQKKRQDDVDKFFRDFSDLAGPAPAFTDENNDGVGESISDGGAADSGSRISVEDTPTAFITRLDDQANNLNQGKTLETMRNKLNTYLGDVDNVVQILEDQRPEYENKSSGFLKIRKPNQAIILRAPQGGELEFQKGNSYLTDGFTITMWVRFVSKTSKGTLFSFGNPLSSDRPYGFRLVTDTAVRPDNDTHKRFFKLGVWDHNNDKFHDNSWGNNHQVRRDTSGRDNYGNGQSDILDTSGNYVTTSAPPLTSPNWGSTSNWRFNIYPKVSTDDLNEWFFICASFDPSIDEDYSLGGASELSSDDVDVRYPDGEDTNLALYHTSFTWGSGASEGMAYWMGGVGKSFWQNHILPADHVAPNGTVNNTGANMYVQNSGLGAKCKVEIISRTDLLRARGFKVGSLGTNV